MGVVRLAKGNTTNTPILKFRIKDLGITDREYGKLILGRRVVYHKNIKAFIDTAESVHISQKRRSHAKDWKEFLELYKPTEWYTMYHDGGDNYRDDTFQVYYK